jgi:hypothetical protein
MAINRNVKRYVVAYNVRWRLNMNARAYSIGTVE